MAQLKTKIEKFGDVEFETIYRETRRGMTTTPQPRHSSGASAVFSFIAPFNPRTYIAEPDIICEQDAPVKMRDGITIYTDIYRPVLIFSKDWTNWGEI